ncbi:non-ribosomal peptide synthetase [Candidatus Odyssella acanthamoebae]|uniref:non-ribosomal peptide synthetase n=1 Tax=Candidatus Odyssella acanthamoebae TaxID=91604 RepID=UPI0022B4BC42|nr:non-ribosomal peptide synthetase [Candidatus Paracaedibacter acanthamoebae]
MAKNRSRSFFVDTDQEKLTKYPTSNPNHITQPHHLAYVIYTSGSTGKPKGVTIEHRSVCGRLLWYQDYAPLTADDGFLHQLSFSFDASVMALWWPLISGAQVIIPAILEDVEHLAGLFLSHSISVLHSTPTTIENLLIALSLKGNKYANLRYVIVGGESLSKTLYEKISSLSGGQIYNAYGPTESSIITTSYDGTGQNITTLTVPIGSPVANTQVYILDPSLNPVPVGVPGELYIGGEGLARGYLNRPELTAERFIANPFRTEGDKQKGKNDRLYRTGDLCRWLEDGNIEYIGRCDDQVKIRGFRIELGEIEAALLKHPQVKEAVVIAREDTPGDKRLVGYLVFKDKGQGAIDVTELRAHLQTVLPDYMVPSAFVILDAIPLTANGKVDRKGLPAPEYRGDEKAYAAPRTETEKALCEIWKSVLKVDKVGIYDNFFELGGHSLLATQVVSRLRSQYGVELSLRDFFKSAVIVDLAKGIASKDATPKDEEFPLLPIQRSEKLPLSFAQARLWFIDQLKPGSALYNIPMALRLEGFLDQNALQAALNKLIERHEALRTVFKTEEGEPYQIIKENLNLDLPLVDLSLLKAEARVSKLKECIEEETLAPFDLIEGPLIRAALIKQNEQEHIFVLTIHHSVADGWSMGIIIDELSELYNATLESREADLAPLPVQYADFSVWQREHLKEEGAAYQKLLAYWEEELQRVPTLLELPTDYSRPPVQSYKGSRTSFSLSPTLTKKLIELSEETQATLFMTLLSAFYALLYRYTNQEDIVVGSPIANRNRQEIERVVGFFVNTLALRANLSSDLSFKDLLLQVKQKALEAYDHQDLPFEKLVEHLEIERSLAQEPIVQVMFILQNAAENSALKLKGLKAKEQTFEYPVAKFDLTLNLIETDGCLQGSFEYAIDLFKLETIERMQRHFQNLLEEIVENPDKNLAQLEMLAAEEKHQLINTWNATQRDYPEDKTIHQQFETQLLKTPNNIAVIFEGQELTYQELNKRANQLAHYLREQGVKPDALVAIACERSLEMIIGILAILKAGGAYVPIDPSYPQDRIQFMLEDTKASMILTQQDVLKRLPRTEAEVFFVDTDQEKLTKYPTSNPNHITQPHHLAYVIYTSGSTGKPKGVTIEHRSVLNLLMSIQENVKLTQADSWLALTTITFDIAGLEIYLPLITGSSFVVTKQKGEADPDYLKRIVDARNISIIQATPSTWRMLLDSGWTSREGMKILTGGEALSIKLFKDLKNLTPYVYNVYGPTETTIWSTFTPLEGDSPTIGKSVANTQVYILDPSLNPVPVGVPGELYIGGEGLARGYLNRPELTAERFIANPFRTEGDKQKGKNDRLYRTGDLCRWLEDGNIEYIGRCDDQVKIRGFRIELGEIEAALLKHPQVKEAVVIAREDTPGDKRLVGYLVFKDKGQGAIDVTELRAHLQTVLPDYMVPSAFVILDAIPLTANGKVDRKGLPAPDYRGDEKAYAAPRTETEKALCEIWKSVLKVDKVGIYDNFFELGGHSLLLVQLHSKLQKEFHLEFSIIELFNHITISKFASYLSNLSQNSTIRSGRKSSENRKLARG